MLLIWMKSHCMPLFHHGLSKSRNSNRTGAPSSATANGARWIQAQEPERVVSKRILAGGSSAYLDGSEVLLASLIHFVLGMSWVTSGLTRSSPSLFLATVPTVIVVTSFSASFVPQPHRRFVSARTLSEAL